MLPRMSPKRDETFSTSEAVESLRSMRELTENADAERQEHFRRIAESLRQPLSTIPFPEVLPPAELETMVEVRQGVQRLSEITAAMLDLGVEQRSAFDASVKSADRSARVVIGLTVALVIFTLVLAALTYVLVAEVAHWWPFGLPATP